MLFVVGLALVGLILLYSTRWYWWPTKRIDPQGKTILVTGAASGFGLHTTKQLVAKGCFVFAADINEEALAKHFGGEKNVRALRCDVTSAEDTQRLFDDVTHVLQKERGGQSLFGLVNNAGIAAIPTAVIDLPEESLRKVLEVNLLGMWRMTKVFFPLLEQKAQDKACIVNVTSVAGLLAASFMGAYSMSKFAAEAFSDVLRKEIYNTGIRVAVIEPYFANTAILDVLKTRDAKLEGAYSNQIGNAVAHVQKVALLPAETIAEHICESLFTSPCKSRRLVAFWKDRLQVYLLRVLPDSISDKLLNKMLNAHE